MLYVTTLAYAEEIGEILHLQGTLAERRQHLFATYVDRMFRRRRAITTYTRQQTERWLTWLAWQMTQHSQTVFHLERMQPDWLPQGQYWIPTQGVRLITILLGALIGGWALGSFGVLLGWLLGERLGEPDAMLIAGLGFGLFGGLLGGLSGGLAGYSKEITSIETVRWSYSEFSRELFRPSRRGLAGGWTFMLLGGLLGGLADGMSDELGDDWAYRLGAGTARGMITGFFIILVSWLGAAMGATLIALGGTTPTNLIAVAFGVANKMRAALSVGLSGAELAAKTTPNEGIHRSARMALISGVSSGLAGGLMGGTVVAGYASIISGQLTQSAARRVAWLDAGLLVGLFAGLVGGLTSGLRYGGRACLQHLVLRLLLRRNGSAPWSYVDFLDYAAERIFLRKVGGGYTFIHPLLQDYFAARHPEPVGGTLRSP